MKRAAAEILASSMARAFREAFRPLPQLPAEVWLEILEGAELPSAVLDELTACEEDTIATAATLALDDRGRRLHGCHLGDDRYFFSVPRRSRTWTRHVVRMYENIRSVEILGPEPARNAYRVRVEDPPAAGCVMVLRFVERRGRKCVVRGSWYDGEISEKEASSGSEATDFFGVTRIVLRCDRRRTIAHVRFGDDVSSPDLTGAKWRKEPAWQPSVGGEAVFFLRADRAPFRVSDGPRDF